MNVLMSTSTVLLERVFLRIGSAETDEQLETVLAKFLTPVLLKLASQADGVRKKVCSLEYYLCNICHLVTVCFELIIHWYTLHNYKYVSFIMLCSHEQ